MSLDDALAGCAADDVLRAVQEGVRLAVLEALAGVDTRVVSVAIQEGVKEAFDLVFGDQILNAITDGVREAMSR